MVVTVGLVGSGYMLAGMKQRRWKPSRTYDQMIDEYVAVVGVQNPKVALEKLKAESALDVQVKRNCHPLVHEIGRAAFRKYKDFSKAAAFLDETCSNGYIQGVMEAYFGKKDDVIRKLKKVC